MSSTEGAKKRSNRKSEYQTPEYITVDVSDPRIETDLYGRPIYTTYRITTETTLPNFKLKNFSVRRRYNDFVWLRRHIKEKMEEKEKRLAIAGLPGTGIFYFGTSRFQKEFIESRRKGLENFLTSVVNHPWARFEPGLRKFLEDQEFICK